MRNIRHQQLTSFIRPAGTSGTIKSAPVELPRGVKGHAILLGLDVDVTIAGAAGGTVNAEGTQRLIDAITIRENGVVRAELSGRLLAYVTSRAQKQAANIAALAGAGAQANTLLHADFVIDWASIFAADPAETAFAEIDGRYPLTVEVQWKSDPQAALISGTGLTLNSATLAIAYMFDPNSKLAPFFLPRIRRTASKAISGVQPNFSVPLAGERQNRIESIVVHSLVDDVTATSLLTGQVTLRDDAQRYIDAVDRRTLLNEQRRFFDAPVPALSYLELYQRTYGKLSEMYVGNQGENIRLEAHVTGSGTVAQFDIFVFEKEIVPGFTRQVPDGW